MAHPVGPRLVERVAAAADAEGVAYRKGGTYVCMEGPQFSSYAESVSYRAQGCDVIGMTAMPEAKLAREAEITYATLAMVTDFDCWHPEHDAVDVASVIQVMHGNIDKARRLVARLARDFPAEREPCPAKSHVALEHAIMTAPSARDPALLTKLDAVAGRVLGA
jgi:5'-methylthioadenosine phosphorylase